MAEKTFDEIHLLIETKIADLLKRMGKGQERADKILKRRINVLVEALDVMNEVKDLDEYKTRLKDLRSACSTSVVPLDSLLEDLGVSYVLPRAALKGGGGS